LRYRAMTMADKCPYASMCKHYRKDSVTCAMTEDYQLRYCGAYRLFLHKRITNKMNEMIGSLAFLSKEEISGV